MIISLFIIGAFNFGIQQAGTSYYGTIQAWIDQQCNREPMLTPIITFNSRSDDLPFTFSKWHDYDLVYEINDNLAQTRACPSTDPEEESD
jgi:hypothetical protein